MAITAYVGLFGHGKSYGVVQNVILPAIERGRSVYTNIPMRIDEWIKRFGKAPDQFDINDIKENPNWFFDIFTPGSVLVVDEAWNLWPAGQTLKNLPDSHKRFFQEHRHMIGSDGLSTDIVVVGSDLSILASWLRSGIETTFKINKLNAVGADKSFRVDIYSGAVVGHSPPEKRRIRQLFGKYKEEITSLYVSQTKSTVGHGQEVGTDKRGNILKSWSFWARFLIPVFAIPFAIYFVVGLFTGSGTEEDHTNDSVVKSSNKTEAVMLNGHEVPKVKSKNVSIFDSVDNIFISFNRGIFPDIDYRFSVEFGGSISTLSEKDLVRLGYRLMAINNCLVKVTGVDWSGFVGCQPMIDDRVNTPVQAIYESAGQ